MKKLGSLLSLILFFLVINNIKADDVETREQVGDSQYNEPSEDHDTKSIFLN